jgi:hypothetical protein
MLANCAALYWGQHGSVSCVYAHASVSYILAVFLCVCVRVSAGALPPSWVAWSKLRELSLSKTRINGTLPSEWWKMSLLRHLELQDNQPTGTIPPSWNQMSKVKHVFLWANQGLTGCAPSGWEVRVNVGEHITVPGPFYCEDLLTAGTNITGYCKEDTPAPQGTDQGTTHVHDENRGDGADKGYGP